MSEQQLKQRTRRFALRVMKLVAALPEDKVGRTIGNQLVRSGTSVGANYRAACQARSTADFIAKLAIVEEEADESGYWMVLIIDGELMKRSRVEALLQESHELVAMIVASRKTASQRAATSKSKTRKSKIKNQK